MSFLTVVPGFVSDAAADLARLGSTLEQANATAAASTTSVVTAAGDEVSAAIASLFSTHGAAYRAVSGQVAAFHDEFVQLLSAGASQYAGAEAAAADPLQSVLDVVNAPTQFLLGRPLIGDGAAGTTVNGVGTNGGDGGLLWGNGGRGGDSTVISRQGGWGGAGGMIGNGGAGGAGGPAGVIGGTAYRGGVGGYGGQGGWLYGSGGMGGVGGSALTGGLGGYGGRGGDALFFGSGGGGGMGGAGIVNPPDSMPGIGGPGGTGGGIPNLFPGIFPNGATGASGQSV